MSQLIEGHMDSRFSAGTLNRILREAGGMLARGLRWHLQDRVLIHGNKTIVFA